MLKSLISKLACPTCKDLRAPLAPHMFNESADDHILDGVLVCTGCQAWFPIEDELLELVPAPLLDRVTLSSFTDRFAGQLVAAGVRPNEAGGSQATDANFDEQETQRKHFDLYAESHLPDFQDYTKGRFMQASHRRYHMVWAEKLVRRGSWILDIGCGTANSSFPFTGDHTVIGFDISKKAIRRDIDEARARGCSAKTTFFVSDGAFLTFKDASFDYVHTIGTLHHLPNPAETIRQIQRVLAPGALHFAVENNRSVFRPIFDFLMKIYPLWIESAGAEPLMSRQMIDDWCRGLPVKVVSQTSIFVPPHLVNILSEAVANRSIDWTDRFFLRVPFLREQGGQILVTIANTNGVYTGFSEGDDPTS